MSSISPSIQNLDILISESLSPWARHVLELSKAYDSIILLYEDDLTGNIMAAWAEMDRLKLKISKVGEILNGLGVYTFGLDAFPADTVIELQLREASQDINRQDPQRSAYKSLLNELILINAKVLPGLSHSRQLS